MGILDFFPDYKDPDFEKLSVNPLAHLGIGMLSNMYAPQGTPLGAIVGRGAMQGMQNLGQAQQSQQKIAMEKLQAQKLQQDLAQQEKMRTLMGKIADKFSGTQQAQSSQPISGVGTVTGQATTTGQQSGFPLSYTDVAALQLAGGPDLTNLYKHGVEGFERKPGSFYDIPGQGRVYVPDPTKGIDFQGGNVKVLPGAAESQATLSGANKEAESRAAAGWKPITITPAGVNANPVLTNERAALAGSQTGFPKVAPSEQAKRDEDRKALVEAEVRNPANKGMPGYDALLQEAQSLGIQLQSPSEAKRAEAAVKIAEKSAASAVEHRDATKNIVDTISLIENRLKDPSLVLGNTPADRAKMFGHEMGMQSRASINTARIQELGQSLVLANAGGSLGAQVSNTDAQRYEQAAGKFNSAKSYQDMVESVKVMKEIAQIAQSNAEEKLRTLGSEVSPAKNEVISKLPKASEHKGKKIRDTETGEILISNGMSWQPVK